MPRDIGSIGFLVITAGVRVGAWIRIRVRVRVGIGFVVGLGRQTVGGRAVLRGMEIRIRGCYVTVRKATAYSSVS